MLKETMLLLGVYIFSKNFNLYSILQVACTRISVYNKYKKQKIYGIIIMQHKGFKIKVFYLIFQKLISLFKTDPSNVYA